MKRYILVYKCRMCRKEIDIGSRLFSDDMLDGVKEYADTKDAHCFHFCDNGDIGMCDLQGFRNTGEEAGYNDILHDALQKLKENEE